MGGIRTPIEIESNLSWNRLVKETFQAIPTPESWDTRWGFQIPPVSYQANGFVYLIGVGSESASPTWRLGCSARLASGAVPDSTGEFNSGSGLPLRIDDRRPCTLGNYTLCIWPDMEMIDPRLIIEFPHWLQSATIEIFWYDGEYSGDFFKKLRESLVEIFGDEEYVDSTLGQYINSRVQQGIAGHSANENAHSQYLKTYEASQQYLRIADLDVAIADSDALRIALDAYILKAEANAAFVKQETFNQERTFIDQAIQEAKDIASADLATHLGATNPHGITPGAIGAIEEAFRGHLHDDRYAAIEHSHESISPEANLQVNSLQLNSPLPISSGGTGAGTAAQARINLNAASNLDIENAIDSHLATSNPHQVTPEMIGAMPLFTLPGTTSQGIVKVDANSISVSSDASAWYDTGQKIGIKLMNVTLSSLYWPGSFGGILWIQFGHQRAIQIWCGIPFSYGGIRFRSVNPSSYPNFSDWTSIQTS